MSDINFDALAWIVLFLLGGLSGLWGRRKGYSFLCWLFAAPGSILVCFLILPFMKDGNNVPGEDKERVVRFGNVTGIVLSCMYPVLLLIVMLVLVASGNWY